MMYDSSEAICLINMMTIILFYSHLNNSNHGLHQHFIVYMLRDDNDHSLSKTCCESEYARFRHATNEG